MEEPIVVSEAPKAEEAIAVTQPVAVAKPEVKPVVVKEEVKEVKK